MLILGAPVSWPWALLTTQLLYCFVAKTLGSQGSVAYPWTFSVSSSCLPSTNWGTAGNSESPSLDAATAPSPGHPQTEDGSQSVFPVMWGYLHRGCSERCWDFRSEKAHSHPAISGEPGGLWLLSLPPHIQVTSRHSGPVTSEPRTSPESLLGLGGTERGTMPRVPQAYTRPGQELCPFQLPSSLAVPQLLICNPNELLTVPICSSLACWGKGARGGDIEKGEAERTVGSRCSAPASPPAAGLLGIYGLHGCPLPSCQRLPLSHTPGGPTPEGERVFERRGCNHYLSCPDP